MSTILSKAEIIRQGNNDWQFPDFTIREFFPKKNEYCVCVFVINEGHKVQKQLKAMKKYSNKVDIIVADGGSTDGSLEPGFLKTVNLRTLLTKTGPGKLSAQMRMAFAYVVHEGYEGVVVVDGNGKDDITAIPHFVQMLDEGYDHVQGSRFIDGGKAINTPLQRLIAVRLLHAPLITLASLHRHTDTTNGFRAYSKKLLKDKKIGLFRDIFKTYELHYHLAIESSRAKKFKLIEIPVTREYPKKGKIPTKISPVKGSLSILYILILAITGRYRLKGKKQ